MAGDVTRTSGMATSTLWTGEGLDRKIVEAAAAEAEKEKRTKK